ncbi:MAG: MFS transporter [Propionibacteriales bacterium]|nr:MFS transporter [Propionibacteriales bacterium]
MEHSSTLTPPAERLEWAKRAVAVTFLANGMAFGSWASRTPAVKAVLHLDASGLGLLLICISIGSLTALPLSGPLVHLVGAGRAVLVSAAAEVSGFGVAAAGLSASRVELTGAGLVLAGLGIGTWDVAMNVEGAAVERWLGRSVMSRFHAGWSLGSVAGAGLGAVCAGIGVGVATQLVVTAVLIAVLAAVGASRYLAFEPHPQRSEPGRSKALLGAGWRDRRTLFIGLMVLAFAFTEGVANDWMAVAVVDGFDSSDAVGAIGFGCFVVAMTLTRLVGGSALDRWGRLVVLRSSVFVAAAGVLVVVTSPFLVLAMAGGLLWGVGTALGFPTGMSAAADDVPRAAIQVSVVSSIGYTAFLAGPPLVGFLGDAFGIRNALYVVLAALVLGLVTTAHARPLPDGMR